MRPRAPRGTQADALDRHPVTFEDGETIPKVLEVYIFRPCAHRFAENELCVARRYDLLPAHNDGDVQRHRRVRVPRQKCVVRHCNPNGSYRVEFVGDGADLRRPLHDALCEARMEPWHGARDGHE